MHRYSAAGGSSGVPGGGGPSMRDTSRSSDSSFQNPAIFVIAARRTPPLHGYQLRCEKEPLSARLGPPDFYPPTPNCAEEILCRDTCQNGYKELIDGIEEPKEALLSLANNTGLWTKANVNRYKESIRKRLRELSKALIRKRKAGQVYGVPLSGLLLAKNGFYPEQRTCGEDFRKKWIEDLSQRKRLRALAEHVPHDYQRRFIFEALIKHDVPLLRATWFVKIAYLNQVKPMSIGMSAGGPDKSQSKRMDLWTKNVLEYTQWLLDEMSQPRGPPQSHSQLMLTGRDSTDGEISKLTKWSYVVRLAHWHYSEGLLHRSQVVDWALKQLQEKETVEALELLLPIVLELIDGISLSQTHVRIIVETCLQWLRKLSPTGHISKASEQSSYRSVTVSIVELLRYLLVIAPDTFVGLDCFPLPPCIICRGDGRFSIDGVSEELDKTATHISDTEISRAVEETVSSISGLNEKRRHRDHVVGEVVDLLQTRAASLAVAVNPVLLRNNEGKVVQALDKAQIQGDVAGAYHCLYDEDFCSSDNLPADWQEKVTSSTAFNLSGPVNPSELFAVKFLCEWAVCDFRDSRGSASKAERRQCAFKDMSRVYIAVSVLCMRLSEMEKNNSSNSSTQDLPAHLATGVYHAGTPVKLLSKKGKKGLNVHRTFDGKVQCNPFPSPGAMHDLIYAWLDQHDCWGGDSSERLPLLLYELVRTGLFGLDAYVRQLLCSGILDQQSSAMDNARASRHRHILQHLPSLPGLIADDHIGSPSVSTASRLYRNEQRLAVYGLNSRHIKRNTGEAGAAALQERKELLRTPDPKPSSGFRDMQGKLFRKTKSKRRKWKAAELKLLIATCLQFPEGSLGAITKQLEPKGGVSLSGFKRQVTSANNSMEIRDPGPGCEECSRGKRLKIIEGKGWAGQSPVVGLGDEDEIWWTSNKDTKVVDSMKVELLVKPTPKLTTRGRPKIVRKTQSLAQLAAPRTESNQGASSSHVLETKVSCPYHQPSSEAGNVTQVKDNMQAHSTGELRSIGAAMKRLRVGESRMIVSWLGSLVRSLVSSGGLTVPSSHYNQGLAIGGSSDSTFAESGSVVRWRMGEEQLAVIVFVMDMGRDFHTLVQLLLWLLPVAATPPSITPSHVNRGVSGLPGKDTSLCDVGEAAILSCLRRYEGLLAAMDLLPQALSAGMQRAANVMAAVPGGRAGCSALLCYVRDLLRKYGSLASVQAWEKCWKASCDQRLGAELEALKAGDSEGGFGLVGGTGDDRDDCNLPRLTGRLARVGTSMKDIVQRGMNEAMHIMINKERDAAALAVSRNGEPDPLEDGYMSAQHVVGGIMDAIRQNGGGSPQADSALVAQAVGTIVNNAGASVYNVLDTLGYNILSGTPASTSAAIRCGRRVLQMHVHCLQLIKDAIGERQTRMLEVTLATEAEGLVMSGMGHSPGRAPRSQFHLSPETLEPNLAMVSDSGGSPSLSRPTIVAAAVAALVACLVVKGITSLERMVSVLRLRDGLENLQLKPGGPTNGRVNTMGSNTKADSLAEANIHWFRVLIGDCRKVLGGLVADLLGEANVLGLARLQRSMPLTTVFPPAYALFAAALRRQQPFHINNMNREDSVIQAITVAVNDMVAHEPFRGVCLRDTRALYLLLSVDAGESEYAAMLDMQGLDMYKKVLAMVPLRARLFLHALLDRKMPEDDIWGQGRSRTASEPGQVEQVVRVLDELQAATFHWQWVELRLILNEQVVLEKLKAPSQSAEEAVQAAMQGTDRQQLAECEKTFTEVVLTRLLVRPDAAALYSEAVHALGRALEEYLILQVKWVLEGPDMLQGRKSLRQLLDGIAVRQGFSVGSRKVKSWGWQPPEYQGAKFSETDEKKECSLQGGASPEEGELEDDGMDWQKSEEKSGQPGLNRTYSQPFATEKGLAELVLPCLVRSSNDTRSGFAFELVKQLINLEQHINNHTRSSSRTSLATASGGDGILGPKGSGARRGTRSSTEAGSPSLGRRFTGPLTDSAPVSAAALQISLWLRLQFLLPLLPMIQTEREQQSARSMRQTLAPVILRLLSTRVVQEAADPISCGPLWESSTLLDYEKNAQAASSAAATSAGEPLFDRLLSVLHALLSSTWAVWMKPRSSSKGPVKPLRDFPPFDRDVSERMQGDVEHMQVPAGVRTRLQAAMPLLLPAPMATIAAGAPQIPASARTLLQSTISSSLMTPSVGHSGTLQKPFLPLQNIGKAKATAMPDPEMEIDPWTLLEDGVGASTGPTGVGEVGTLKACVWLKGAVRVRRGDLTYVGAVDEDP